MSDQATLMTGTEVYDALMEDIESELTSENVKKLDQKYRDESIIERTARMQKYERAFALYEKRKVKYLNAFHNGVTEYKRDMRERSEEEDRAKEAAMMTALEQSLSS